MMPPRLVRPMRPSALLVLAALLVAGCAAPTPAPAPGREAPPPAALSFRAPVEVAPKPNPQVESFLATSPDGETLLACLHGDFRAPPPTYASRDGGSSWTRVEVGGLVASGDCDVAMGHDGAWHVLATLLAGAGVATSRDEGRSWTSSHLAAPPTNGAVDRPWLAAAGERLVLAYMPLFLQPGVLAFTRSEEGGATWSPPRHLTRPEPGRTHVSHGQFLVVDQGETLRIPLLQYDPTRRGVAHFSFALSEDAGASWTLVPVAGPVEAVLATPVSVAQAADGTLFWTYLAPNGTEAVDLLAMVSRDGGASWSGPRAVLGGWPACGEGCFVSPIGIPWMDGGPGATAALAFVEEGRLVVARLDADAPGLLVAKADVAEASPVEFLEVDHDGTGRAHVAYTHDGKLWHAREEPAWS